MNMQAAKAISSDAVFLKELNEKLVPELEGVGGSKTDESMVLYGKSHESIAKLLRSWATAAACKALPGTLASNPLEVSLRGNGPVGPVKESREAFFLQ